MMLDEPARELAARLGEISSRGPIPSEGHGDTAVGMTLLRLLDIPYSSASKPTFRGIVITARRGTKVRDSNRVNLFAKVPDWEISACKSSREILDRYGYDRAGGRKLNCTVAARQPNSQGLRLLVDREAGTLCELHDDGAKSSLVAAWWISGLEAKLETAHRASVWVVAVPSWREGVEHFHFRYATFTSQPRTKEFVPLIEQRTITVDHLISESAGAVVEKGPLFKILPDNAGALFPGQMRVDLLDL